VVAVIPQTVTAAVEVLVAGRIRRRLGLAVHDIGPVRVCRREPLLDLGVADRRFGYPLELLVRAAHAGWRVTEVDITYHARAAGTRSKVSGSVRGTLRAIRDFRIGPAMTGRPDPVLLLVAKAPVPGQAKTRLTPPATPRLAAGLAAAALLDTCYALADSCRRAGHRTHR
jgi:hypothetical protein